jgi:hypothetical protein
MRKILVAVVAAATLAGAAVATSGPALAYHGGWHGGWHGGGWRGGGWGWGAGGFVAGALVGSALAAPYGYGYGYGYPAYYGYPAPYYGRPCVWRRWWNGYAWVRGCV